MSGIYRLILLFSCSLFPFWSAGENHRLLDHEKWVLTQYADWAKDNGGNRSLSLKIPLDATLVNMTYGAHLELDLTPFRGKQIVISGMISGQEIPPSRERHNCAKLMLVHHGPGGEQYIQSSQGLWGTFPERLEELSFAVPESPGKNILMIGIQNNHGAVQIRNVKLEERDLFPAPAPLPEDFRCEYSDSVRNAPRLRGAGTIPSSTEQDMADFAALGGNVLRWWIRYDATGEATSRRRTLTAALDRLQAMLPTCDKLGLKIIPVLVDVPGGRYQRPEVLGADLADISEQQRSLGNFRLFFDKALLDDYVAIWQEIATRFRHSPAVWGYSLMNEPTQFGRVPFDYLKCQYLAAAAIRKIDPEKPVIVSANDWDNAEAFPYLKPLPLRNVLYEVHMYAPHRYTHQGVSEESLREVKQGKFLVYPGRIDARQYDRQALRLILQPVVEFQKKYGAIVYCGEFSVIRWAPGGAKYLDDLCSIFEELGWHWAYHCYRDWDGWNPEYSDLLQEEGRVLHESSRMKVLKKYWRKNGSGKKQLSTRVR